MKRENLGVFASLLSISISVSIIVLTVLKITGNSISWLAVFSPILVPIFLLCAFLIPVGVVSLIMGVVTYFIDIKNEEE